MKDQSSWDIVMGLIVLYIFGAIYIPKNTFSAIIYHLVTIPTLIVIGLFGMIIYLTIRAGGVWGSFPDPSPLD